MNFVSGVESETIKEWINAIDKVETDATFNKRSKEFSTEENQSRIRFKNDLTSLLGKKHRNMAKIISYPFLDKIIKIFAGQRMLFVLCILYGIICAVIPSNLESSQGSILSYEHVWCSGCLIPLIQLLVLCATAVSRYCSSYLDESSNVLVRFLWRGILQPLVLPDPMIPHDPRSVSRRLLYVIYLSYVNLMMVMHGRADVESLALFYVLQTASLFVIDLMPGLIYPYAITAQVVFFVQAIVVAEYHDDFTSNQIICYTLSFFCFVLGIMMARYQCFVKNMLSQGTNPAFRYAVFGVGLYYLITISTSFEPIIAEWLPSLLRGASPESAFMTPLWQITWIYLVAPQILLLTTQNPINGRAGVHVTYTSTQINTWIAAMIMFVVVPTSYQWAAWCIVEVVIVLELLVTGLLSPFVPNLFE